MHMDIMILRVSMFICSYNRNIFFYFQWQVHLLSIVDCLSLTCAANKSKKIKITL